MTEILRRIERIERAALVVPGVVKAESWGFSTTRRLRPDDSESGDISLYAPPAATTLLQPTVLQGRWLLPQDERAVVINTDVLKDEPDVKVGDDLVLKLDGRDTTWRVVGIVQGVLTGPIAYANYPYFARTVREVERASGVRIVTAQHGAGYQSDVAKALQAQFERANLPVIATQTISEMRARMEFQFNILVSVLLIMAVLLAIVGGLGLMGTMSINVLERTREMGVMRAIGASTRSVLQIVMVEGIFIGLLSWLAGSALALPLSRLLSAAVGQAFLRAPLNYTFSVGGALIWFGAIVMLAGLSSFLPAWNASRLSVRAVLAYE
jgi:putative ABC transport system permease protein